MSLWRDELRPSRATLATLIAVALVAVASLSSIIESPDYVLWALTALAIGAAFAVFFGRRSLGLGFILLVAGTVLTLPALFVREGGKHIAPTPDAIRALRELIASGLADAPKAIPPVAAQPKYLVLVWTACLLLGFLGASWVIVRRPVGAILSALGVVTFTGSLGDGRGRTAFAIATVAAIGAFFLAEGRHRIGRWGAGHVRLPEWFGIPTLAGACAIALVAPFVIGETPLVELRAALRPRIVIIKPLSDIKRQLKVDPPIEVLRVTVTPDRPTYWRLTGLDAYDGREWVLEAHPREVRNGAVPEPKPPTSGEAFVQEYQLTSLLSPWLPAAYAARSVTNTDATVEVDEGSQTLLLRREDSPGLTYTVTSRIPKVTVNIDAPPGKVTDERAKLFGDLARPIIGDKKTPLDIARTLEQHFRKFTYNEDVEVGHSVERLQRFLTARTGYCEQFAATMTLMLRGLGIDARVGVGFLPGSQSINEYVVSTKEAHAWVEADIPGAGWTTFDPTPGRGEPSAAPAETEQQREPQNVPQATALPQPTPATEDLPEDVTTLPGNIPLEPILWTLLAVAIVAVVPSAKRIQRARRKTAEPSASVLGAYAELTDRARELGWTNFVSETHREFSWRIDAGRDGPAMRLAALTSSTLFGPDAVSRAEAREAWTAFGQAHTNLRKRAPAWRRAIAIFDPRVFLPQLSLRHLRLRLASAFGR